MERRRRMARRIERLKAPDNAREGAKEKAQMKSLTNTSSKLLKHPHAKVVVFGAILYGVIHVSKYFIRASAGMIDACKDFKNTCQR